LLKEQHAISSLSDTIHAYLAATETIPTFRLNSKVGRYLTLQAAHSIRRHRPDRPLVLGDHLSAADEPPRKTA